MEQEVSSYDECSDGIDPASFKASTIVLTYRDMKIEFTNVDLEELHKDPDYTEIFMRHRDPTINNKLSFPKAIDRKPNREGLTKIVSQNARHCIELFFTELIDNADQATTSSLWPIGLMHREIVFHLNMASSFIEVKDNGFGQDEHGLVGTHPSHSHGQARSGTRHTHVFGCPIPLWHPRCEWHRWVSTTRRPETRTRKSASSG